MYAFKTLIYQYLQKAVLKSSNYYEIISSTNKFKSSTIIFINHVLCTSTINKLYDLFFDK